jgi:Glyoxalase/Bleomycin resistance protein/Dioxygenase superfamily
VAHAVPRWQDAWGRYATDLGAQWSSGGPNVGFAPGQLRFGNGARIELLMPYEPERNDFLARFLDRSGPGPHHLTFKVPDLDVAIEEARRAGRTPINEDRSDPDWFEVFLHPKGATGIVVQLAQTPITWVSDPPADYPTERRQRADGSRPVAPAALERACHVVADLGDATALFVDLLDGRVVAEGFAGGILWMDVSWAGPLRLRLLAAARPDAAPALEAWLGGRPGRLRHLDLVVDEPGTVAGVGALSELPAAVAAAVGAEGGAADAVEILPEANLGLGLVLTAAEQDPTGR